jgi:hypothetical protein
VAKSGGLLSSSSKKSTEEVPASPGKNSLDFLDETESKLQQNQVQRGLFLDVVVRQGASILQLFASEDQALLIRRNADFRKDLNRKNHHS